MKYLIILLLFVAGCGSGEVLVTYETVDREFLDSVCSSPYPCDGFAIWNHDIPQKICTMYLLPMSKYPTEADYYETRGHESRHCEVGYFH